MQAIKFGEVQSKGIIPVVISPIPLQRKILQVQIPSLPLPVQSKK